MGGAFHSGEDFERGRVRHVQQEERLDGVEPTDAREDEPDERAPQAAAARAPRPTYVDLGRERGRGGSRGGGGAARDQMGAARGPQGGSEAAPP